MRIKSRKSFGTVSITVGLFALLLAAGPVAAQRFSGWSAPVNLGPVVNSPFDDQHMAISKDGLSLYFSSNRPGGCGGLDLWVTQRASVGEPWAGPQNLGCTLNSSGADFAPNFSPDGHFLYFTSRRPGGCGIGDLDTYVSRRHNKRDDFAWGPAENLGCIVNTTFRESGPTYFEDDATGIITLFFTCADRPENLGADICASTLGPEGTFGPGQVVPDLSSPFNETRVAIRRDGLEIFFPSNRPGTFGNLDLWTSTRATTSDPWSLPVNMGALINSSAEDEAPSLSFDGTELYFFSARSGFGGRDLYVMTRTKLTGPQ